MGTERLGAPHAIRWLALVYLVGLLVAGAAWGLHAYLPDPIAGVPLGVPWLAAVAAVLRSLDGIFFHGYKGVGPEVRVVARLQPLRRSRHRHRDVRPHPGGTLICECEWRGRPRIVWHPRGRGGRRIQQPRISTPHREGRCQLFGTPGGKPDAPGVQAHPDADHKDSGT
jgi:hypothetical protein